MTADKSGNQQRIQQERIEIVAGLQQPLHRNHRCDKDVHAQHCQPYQTALFLAGNLAQFNQIERETDTDKNRGECQRNKDECCN